MNQLAVVTATTDLARSEACRKSWWQKATGKLDIYTVVSGFPAVEGAPFVDRSWSTQHILGMDRASYYTTEWLGVVPAFALGVQKALEAGAQIVACFHDDLEIHYVGWDTVIRGAFGANPQMGLAGFGGGVGLGDDLIYQTPFSPMQLARQGFRSNMRDAEAHGERTTIAQRVACLDGFSQIGRREFWQGIAILGGTSDTITENLFTRMASWGIVHHMYDGALGCFAKRLGWETWLLPIPCHHFGGLTAVADPRYHQWANGQLPEGFASTGDQAFWITAHSIVYSKFKDVLPIRT